MTHPLPEPRSPRDARLLATRTQRSVAIALALVFGRAALAQTAAPQSAAGSAAIPQALVEHRPTIAITHHAGVFGGRTVSYSAIVEEHILTGPDSVPNASLVTIAYVADGIADQSTRPVMFVFNGGPGASSSPLHMNGIGPRRLAPDSSGTIENPNSILDVTDLVFIDPVGTGFSRPYTTDAGRRYYWGRVGDAESVMRVIDMWLDGHGRRKSPRYLAGESYGAMRVGMIFRTRKDARFDGLLLVAVVGDWEGREMPYVTALPTMAASAWYWKKVHGKGSTAGEVFDAAARFTRTEYLQALFQGRALPRAEKARVAREMASFVGVPAAYIEAMDLRLSNDDWMLHVLQERNLRTGMLDTRVTGVRDTTRTGGLNDPAFNGGKMRIGTAMLAPALVPGADTQPRAVPPSLLERYLKDDLKFSTPESYRALNLDINGVWNWDDRSETNSEIAAAMTANPAMRVFWAAGYYDLSTPAYATIYAFNQVGIPADRLTKVLLPGAHSVFADEANQRELAARLRRWIR